MTLTPKETLLVWKQAYAQGETTLPYAEWMRWNGIGLNGERVEYETA